MNMFCAYISAFAAGMTIDGYVETGSEWTLGLAVFLLTGTVFWVGVALVGVAAERFPRGNRSTVGREF